MRNTARSLHAASHFCGFVLLACSSVAALADTETWSGGDNNDSNWTSNGNWTGVGGAAEFDALVFPSSASRKTTSFNDFAPDTNFASLSFTGGGYSISGNRVLLGAGGITANIPSGAFVFGPSIRLGISQAFDNIGASAYTLNGDILLNDHDLGITGSDTVVNGAISGSGRSLTKNGTGTLTINSNSSSFGVTHLNAGTLRVDGALGALDMIASPTLSGSGVVGNISLLNTSGAKTIAPGSNGTAAGTLTAGNVVLNSSVTLKIDLNGIVPAQYDRLATTSIDLNGATLSVALGFPLANGTPFTIITGAVSGQFAGLGQGATVTAGANTFSITYNANSVVLTKLSTARTWSGASAGAGGNDNWTTAANWVGGVAPSTGDSLVFPNSAARKVNTNTFAAGTAFGSLTVTGNDYNLSGAQINLSAGISASPPAGGSAGPLVLVPIKLTAAQTFANDGSKTVALGAVDLNGFALSVGGTENINFLGQLTGAGGIIKSGSATLFLFAVGNSYTGTTQVNGGVVQLDKDAAAGSAAPGDGTTVTNGAMLRVANNTSHTEPLTLNGTGIGGSGALGTAANACTVAGCLMTGPITLATNSLITTLAVAEKLTLGPVGQSGGTRTLTVGGPGTVTMTGTSTYSGGTTVSGGTLLVNGVIGNVTLSAGTTLGGIGTVGNVTGPGTVAPGASAGILNANGTVTFVPQSVFSVEIGGTTVGTQYDQLNVTGTVTLGGATLQGSLINGFTPAPGNAFTIIQSTGGVIGQFAGLAQGGSLTINGVAFNITYNANSVVLAATAAVVLPDLTISKTHTGNFAAGQIGATYTATVTNSGAGPKAAGSLVSVVDTPPSGLAITAMSGTGWTCTTLPTCTRTDVLAGFQSYPPITITVNVAGNATSPQVNSVTVTTVATEGSTANNIATDPTIVGTPLTITKSGSGTGTVTSQDGGINCGATCTNAYASGSNITLTATPAGGSVFTGWLGPCTGTGTCVVAIGGSAASVSATFALATIGTRILDVDANNAYDALSDGLMAIRYLFGLTGTALTANATGPGATRTDPALVLAYLNDIRPYLDADGNGNVDALTDGLLIIRDLFGLTDAALVNNAIGPNATRTTGTAVHDYLTTLKP